MAIELANKVNVDAPSTDYPYGKIRDDDGSGNGTPVSVEVYGDIHQFLARLAAEAGITFNNLPDNATNGFQYWDAFVKFTFANTWTSVATVASVPTGTISAASGPITTFNKFIVMGKTLIWNVNYRYTVTGTPPYVKISLPTEIVTGMGLSIIDRGLKIACTVDDTVGMVSVGSNVDGTFVNCSPISGSIVGGQISFSLTVQLS